MNFIYSFQSEWLKKKRSLASWLVVGGAFFVPSIILASRIKNRVLLEKLNTAEDFWQKIWTQSWEAMAVVLLPVGIILVTALLAQIEFKNNCWKQLHAAPQALTTIFFAKFLALMVMLGQVFALFLAGIYLSAVAPSVIFADAPYPPAPIPFQAFAAQAAGYFVCVLPVAALQFLLSLQFKNFLVPVGVGFAIWFLGVGLLSWEYSYLFPYNHGAIEYLMNAGQFKNRVIPFDVKHLALVYFAAFALAGWFLYVTKKEKG